MYRSPNSSNEYPCTPHLPMFTRHLNVLGSSWSPSAQTSLGWWRTPYPFNPSWWMGHPPRYRQFHPVHFGNPVPGALDIGTWQRSTPGLAIDHPSPRFLFTGFQRALHISHGVMDDAKTGPPHKRRRSIDEPSQRTGQKPQSSPSRLPRPEAQGVSSNSAIPNGPPPGEIQTSPQKTRGPADLTRHWEDFSHLYKRRSKSDRPFDFSVMSYNILSQQLLQDNIYLYKHCPSCVLDWSHRFPNILKELELHNADILCLQEVQEDHYIKQLKPSLESLGYHCEYKRRTGWKSDGCAVGFKRDRFSLVSQHPVEYFRRDVPLLDRDNVGLVLMLRPLAPPGASGAPGLPGRVVCVANTHLLYNPRRGDVKLAQLAVLLAEITRVSRLGGEGPGPGPCPVVLCGDFNSVPGSPLYSFIRDSRLEYEGIPIGMVSGQEESHRGQRLLPVPIWPRNVGISQSCQYESPSPMDAENEGEASCLTEGTVAPHNKAHRRSIAHGLRLTSAYAHRLKESGWPEVTTCHSRTAITVDYIFYTAARGDVAQPECSAAPEQGLQLLARLALVDKTALWTANGLPNERHSSDHLPLLTSFRLCP